MMWMRVLAVCPRGCHSQFYVRAFYGGQCCPACRRMLRPVWSFPPVGVAP